MKKSKFSEAQIVFILRQADEGTPVAEVCRTRLDDTQQCYLNRIVHAQSAECDATRLAVVE
jgi:hypothetical protein